MFGDVADEFRTYMDGVNLTEIRQEWEAYQAPATARRLSGVTIESADGTSRAINSADGLKGFISDAFSGAIDLSQEGLDRLAILKTGFEVPTKGQAIEKLVGYMPQFANWADETHVQFKILTQNLTQADTFDEATAILEAAAQPYCEDGKLTPSTKKPTSCEGPKVALEFVPKKCVVVNHELECRPAKLVLKKKAGRCTMKHYSPVEYKHKECQFSKTWGKNDTELHGGDEFTAGKVSTHLQEAVA